MDTGYAILEGTAHPGRGDELLGLVEERLPPLRRQMPHARAVTEEALALLNGRSCHAIGRRRGPA